MIDVHPFLVGTAAYFGIGLLGYVYAVAPNAWRRQPLLEGVRGTLNVVGLSLAIVACLPLVIVGAPFHWLWRRVVGYPPARLGPRSEHSTEARPPHFCLNCAGPSPRRLASTDLSDIPDFLRRDPRPKPAARNR